MKRFLAVATAFAFAGTAMAADLNVRVVVGDSSTTDAAPGATVNYAVLGTLSDTSNEGLALFGFDLLYDGGDLDPAEPGSADITDSFVSPYGINNPAGFGGTIIAGDLIQVGGGQNTIKNTLGNAPFPIGCQEGPPTCDMVSFFTGIGHSEEVLATGSLIVPGSATDGSTLNLTLSNLFANVIQEGETGMPPQNFWKTEAAGVGTITSLVINVVDEACVLDSSTPAHCSIDGRDTGSPDGGSSAGWDAITLTFADMSCAAGVNPGDIVVTVTGGAAPSVLDAVANGNDVDVTLDSEIPAGEWTCFEIAGSSSCLGFSPADVDGDAASDADDIGAMIAVLDGNVVPDMRADTNRDGTQGPKTSFEWSTC